MSLLPAWYSDEHQFLSLRRTGNFARSLLFDGDARGGMDITVPFLKHPPCSQRLL